MGTSCCSDSRETGRNINVDNLKKIKKAESKKGAIINDTFAQRYDSSESKSEYEVDAKINYSLK